MPHDRDRHSHPFQLSLSTETLARLEGVIHARSHSYHELQLMPETEKREREHEHESPTRSPMDPRPNSDEAFALESSEVSTLRAHSGATITDSVDETSRDTSSEQWTKSPFASSNELLPESRRTTIGEPPAAWVFEKRPFKSSAPAAASSTPTVPKPPSSPLSASAGGSGSPPSLSSLPTPPLTGPKLYSTISALYLTTFLTALDRTVLVTAIPTIIAEFDSLPDIGWYGSTYFLTFCCFQLIFGKLYAFYNAKWVFMIAVAIFLAGSAVGGAARSSVGLIVGRAIAGVGGSGIFVGSVIIMFFTVPVHLRAIYSGGFGVVFAVASIVGPVIGGALTQYASWRWCFWTNLPLGAVTLGIVVVLLHLPPARKAGTPWKEQIMQMDPLGNLCLMPAVFCLLLALQWGGSTYAWSNGRIVALLVLAGVLGLAFIGIQIRLGDNATVPPKLFKQRSVAAAFVYTLGVTGSMLTLSYYLPVWFQAIKSASPTRSGVMMLPMVVPSAITGILSGMAIPKFVGYYVPFMLACSALMAIGAGLLTTFDPSTGQAAWVGYQIIWGFGAGLGIQSGGLVAQTVLTRIEAPQGISLNFFAQSLSGCIFLAIAQSLFMNGLHNRLDGIPGIDVNTLDATGASLRDQVSAQQLPTVLSAYNRAVTDTFILATGCACLAFAASCGVEWKDARREKDQVGRDTPTPSNTEKKA